MPVPEPPGTAMTEAERLTDFLFHARGRAYCDDCLSQELGIAPALVREQTRILTEDGWSKRSEEPCAGCGVAKSVIRRRVSAFAA
jgi:hypothetical protein